MSGIPWKASFSNPTYVGYWLSRGNNFRIYVEHRPRWLTRVMAKLLLEFEWVDQPIAAERALS